MGGVLTRYESSAKLKAERRQLNTRARFRGWKALLDSRISWCQLAVHKLGVATRGLERGVRVLVGQPRLVEIIQVVFRLVVQGRRWCRRRAQFCPDLIGHSPWVRE